MALRTGKGVKEENLIVVAHDLSPADVIAYKEHRFAAFVTDVGGATSHTAILARSLRIPAVLGLLIARQLIRDDEVLIVDGTRGVLIVNPDPRVLDEYRLRKSQIELERSKLRRLKTALSSTLDGVDIDLHANIELPGDVANALDGGAEGIGLFRTEFIFLDRGDMPTEEEQFEAYRTVVKGMAGRPVTIRTFDLGYDKDLHPEKVQGDRMQSNPALGLRAIRLSLAEPKMFHTQLRAILRASKYGKIKLLIPMLSQAYEIDQTLLAIDFLDAGNDVISSAVLDVDAVNLNDGVWRQFSVGGVAPAGTVSVQARASFLDGVLQLSNPQSAFVDDFDLTPEPSSLALIGLGAMALIRRR